MKLRDGPALFSLAALRDPALLGLLVAAAAFGGLLDRPILYDEAISFLEVSGYADPRWPDEIRTAAELAGRLEGRASLGRIAADLRQTDVHPPVYFWALSLWRGVYGTSLEVARAFSTLAVIVAAWALWGVLRLARAPRPLLPAAFFALASGTIYAAQIARPYSLALSWICLGALLAYAATERHAGLPAGLGMALAVCLAFSTNYLALFPGVAVLAFYSLRRFPTSKAEALGLPLVAALASTPTLAFVLRQLDARPEQEAGFAGPWAQIRHLAEGMMTVIADTDRAGPVAVMLLVAAASAGLLIRHRRRLDRALLLLFAGLVLAPVLGLAILNLVFDKNLREARYLIFAAPGVAALLGYGLAHTRRFAWLLAVPVLGLQWLTAPSTAILGSTLPDPPPRSGPLVLPESTLVVIGAGHGRGDPAASIYGLDPPTHVLILDETEDLALLEAALVRFRRLAVMPAGDGATAELEEEAKKRALKVKRGLPRTVPDS